MEIERLAAYLEKTRNNYKHRIAYCIKDFRTAMEKAVKMVDIKVDLVPRESTIQTMLQPDKPFIYNSLSTREYTFRTFPMQLLSSQASREKSLS